MSLWEFFLLSFLFNIIIIIIIIIVIIITNLVGMYYFVVNKIDSCLNLQQEKKIEKDQRRRIRRRKRRRIIISGSRKKTKWLCLMNYDDTIYWMTKRCSPVEEREIEIALWFIWKGFISYHFLSLSCQKLVMIAKVIKV